MDVFKVKVEPLQGSLGSPPETDQVTPEVSFDAGSEFNLSFFSQEEGSSGQGGFSDPGSVGSGEASSPPPATPGTHISAPSTPAGLLLTTATQELLTAGTITVKQEQQYVAADSNSNASSTKSFVPCKVCGDKASGYHYGVTSCEGCKGFFRRSIQKQIEYRCLRDGKCLVIRLNRNRCQYCRFKKCLAVGMSRDSVRYGRVPKRSRERSTDSSTVSTTVDPIELPVSTVSSVTTSPLPLSSPVVVSPPVTPVEVVETKPNLAVYDIIVQVSQAHHANCAYTEDATRGLLRKSMIPLPQTVEDHEVASSTAESLETERIWLWQQWASNMTPNVQRVVEFAKRIPGFCDLGQDDQLILIKLGFFELWLTHVAKLTNSNSLTFDDGMMVTRQQMDTMYDTDFVTSFMHFSSSLNSLGLNDTEIGLFSAVVLITGDRPGLTDIKTIEHHQDKLIEALKVQLARNHSSEPQLLSNLLLKLPELRNLGAKHSAHLDWFRANWTKLTLPPLFAEIFDIPKCEDDLQ